MARQRIHNRRAARGSVGGGASWISYSDMMAALLLIFVLILTYSLSHYFSMLESKDLLLRQTMHELGHTTQNLELKTRELTMKDRQLDLKDQELQQNIIILNEKDLELQESEKQLNSLRVVLTQREDALKLSEESLRIAQKAMRDQADQLDALIGIRRTMISDLSSSFARAGIEANVDENGNIVLNSSVFFESGKSAIRPEGQAFLDRFIPVYLNVLLRDEYSEYLGEIIIEGHTDSVGTYESNLKLSQQRALEVAIYCLNMPSLTQGQKNLLQKILTAKGRSESDLIMVDNGYGLVEDPDASRRVEFKFSLKDSQMIQDMSNILRQQNLGE